MMEFRRTLIPILLTSGVLALVAGGAIALAGPDNPLGDITSRQSGMICLAAGALLVLSAVFNMWSVKRDLRRPSPPR